MECSNGLSNSAKHLAKEICSRGLTNYKKPHFKEISKRVEKFGRWKRGLQELVVFGENDPKEIILKLIIGTLIKITP